MSHRKGKHSKKLSVALLKEDAGLFFKTSEAKTRRKRRRMSRTWQPSDISMSFDPKKLGLRIPCERQTLNWPLKWEKKVLRVSDNNEILFYDDESMRVAKYNTPYLEIERLTAKSPHEFEMLTYRKKQKMKIKIKTKSELEMRRLIRIIALQAPKLRQSKYRSVIEGFVVLQPPTADAAEEVKYCILGERQLLFFNDVPAAIRFKETVSDTDLSEADGIAEVWRLADMKLGKLAKKNSHDVLFISHKTKVDYTFRPAVNFGWNLHRWLKTITEVKGGKIPQQPKAIPRPSVSRVASPRGGVGIGGVGGSTLSPRGKPELKTQVSDVVIDTMTEEERKWMDEATKEQGYIEKKMLDEEKEDQMIPIEKLWETPLDDTLLNNLSIFSQKESAAAGRGEKWDLTQLRGVAGVIQETEQEVLEAASRQQIEQAGRRSVRQDYALAPSSGLADNAHLRRVLSDPRGYEPKVPHRPGGHRRRGRGLEAIPSDKQLIPASPTKKGTKSTKNLDALADMTSLGKKKKKKKAKAKHKKGHKKEEGRMSAFMKQAPEEEKGEKVEKKSTNMGAKLANFGKKPEPKPAGDDKKEEAPSTGGLAVPGTGAKSSAGTKTPFDESREPTPMPDFEQEDTQVDDEMKSAEKDNMVDVANLEGSTFERIRGEGVHVFAVKKLDIWPMKYPPMRWNTRGAYLVVHTKGRSPPKFHVHYWIGANCPVDSRALAAFKAVEVRDFLGSMDKIILEEEGTESQQFKEMLEKDSITVGKGASSTGLKKQDKHPQLDPYLLEFSDDYFIKVREVPLSWEFFKPDVVLVLVSHRRIWIWSHRSFYQPQLTAATLYASSIKTHYQKISRSFKGKESTYMKTFVIDTDENPFKPAFDPIVKEFFHPETAEDEDEDGRTVSKEWGEWPEFWLRDQLQSDCSYVFECQYADYVWHGWKATPWIRWAVTEYLENYIKPKGKKLYIMFEEYESPLFKNLFSDWFWHDIQWPQIRERSNGQDMDLVLEGLDCDKLWEENLEEVEASFTPDLFPFEERVTLVYEITNDGFHRIPKAEVGRFHRDRGYAISCVSEGLPKPVCQTEHDQLQPCRVTVFRNFLYFWFGSECKMVSIVSKVRDILKFMHTSIENSTKKPPKVQMVFEHQEPFPFFHMFDIPFISMAGQSEIEFNVEKGARDNVGGVAPAEEEKTMFWKKKTMLRLFRHREVVRAREVEVTVTSLNSGDAFVLADPSTGLVYAWYGHHCHPDERVCPPSFCGLVFENYDLVEIEEGQETADFWACIGGSGAYAKVPFDNHLFYSLAPLYVVTHGTILTFSASCLQEMCRRELDSTKIVFVDVITHIFVWVGKEALPMARVHAKKFSIKLSCTMAHVRPLKFKVVWEKEGEESLLFQSLFPDWNQNMKDWGLYKFDMGSRILAGPHEVSRTAFQSCYSVPPASWDMVYDETHKEDFYDRLMLNLAIEKKVKRTVEVKGKLVTDLVDIEQLEVDFNEFEGNIMQLFDELEDEYQKGEQETVLDFDEEVGITAA